MSSNKVNNSLDFRNMKQTQFDSGQVLKGSFSELMSALRSYNVNAVIKDAYTHFIQELDSNDRPVLIDYYQATKPAIDSITLTDDVSGNSSGKYFALFNYISKKNVLFYYTVDSVGTAPGLEEIEIAIDISENDPASVKAFATAEVINQQGFLAKQVSFISPVITIEYLEFGETPVVYVGTTGFTTSRIQNGDSVRVGTVSLSYNGNGDPIYNGQLLKNHVFNVYNASFDTQFKELVRNETFHLYQEDEITAGSTFTLIDYDVIDTQLILKLVSGSSLEKGIFSILVNDNVVDKRILDTYNVNFTFCDLLLDNGDNVKVIVKNVSANNADFNVTLSGINLGNAYVVESDVLLLESGDEMLLETDFNIEI